jgi:hypothetical protein
LLKKWFCLIGQKDQIKHALGGFYLGVILLGRKVVKEAGSDRLLIAVQGSFGSWINIHDAEIRRLYYREQNLAKLGEILGLPGRCIREMLVLVGLEEILLRHLYLQRSTDRTYGEIARVNGMKLETFTRWIKSMGWPVPRGRALPQITQADISKALVQKVKMQRGDAKPSIKSFAQGLGVSWQTARNLLTNCQLAKWNHGEWLLKSSARQYRPSKHDVDEFPNLFEIILRSHSLGELREFLNMFLAPEKQNPSRA